VGLVSSAAAGGGAVLVVVVGTVTALSVVEGAGNGAAGCIAMLCGDGLEPKLLLSEEDASAEASACEERRPRVYPMPKTMAHSKASAKKMPRMVPLLSVISRSFVCP
jgi:hypothetical protein